MYYDEGESRYWSTYILSLVIYLVVISLLTGGFVSIAYTAVKPWFSLPYSILVINILGGLVYLAFLITVLRRDRYISFLDSLIDLFLVILLLYTGYTGVFLSVIVMIIAVMNAEEDERYEDLLVPSVIMTIIILISFPVLYTYSPVSGSHYIQSEVMTQPITVYGVYRLIPLYTAHVYGIDRVQLPTHTLYLKDSYLYYNNRTPIYNWIIEPEGIVNEYTKKPRGLVLVYGDQFPPKVVIVNKELKYGLHNNYFKGIYVDNLARETRMRSLGRSVLLDENIEKIYNNHIYIIIPVISWSRGGLYSIPVPDSFIVINEVGEINVIPFKEAVNNPLFNGVPLIPEKVAREWVKIYNYHRGYIEYYFQHNKYRIPDVGDNPQPYLTISRNGTMYWTFVVEPSGKTYSVKHIIYVKAHPTTPKPRVFLYTPSTSLIGVSKVESYVESEHPNFDWNKLKVVEPLPTIINGTIYWKLSIITNDYRGLVAVDLVDAKTSKVITLETSKEKSITSQALLKVMEQTTPTNLPTNQTQQPVIEQIKELKKEINQTIQQLNAMYKRLSQLEQQLENRTKSSG